MYLIQFQFILSPKIRQELRIELGFINIYILPILIILNIYFLVVINNSNSYSLKNKRLYSILSVIFYIFLVSKMVI